MSSSSKRKSNASADFKRIKAKVGKKAKRLNDTDVSFQSASLHLGQSFQRDDESVKSGNVHFLVSSRGKSLHQLYSTASTHPAAAARSSSLKGILDIIKKYPSAALLPNLSTLIPSCVHSCVDEDEQVRSVGIEAFSSLLQKLQEKKVKPFGALLVARVSSALHSLDASIRVNGVKMVSILSATCPLMTSSFVDKILPPFGGLLSDQRTKKSIDEILQSLISVLRVNATRCSYDDDVQSSMKIYQQPDLLYYSGGRSRNTILRDKRFPRVFPHGIESTLSLSRLGRHGSSSFNVEKMVVSTKRQRVSPDEALDANLKTNLLTKIRDCLIESINLEYEPAMASIKKRSSSTESQGSMNFPRVLLLLRSIRFLSRSPGSVNKNMLDDNGTHFDKIANQIMSIMIDLFPLDKDPSTDSSIRDINLSIINDANAAIAITLLEMSQETTIDNGQGGSDNVKGWIKTICSYVLPRIERLGDKEVSSSSDLDLTCKLLRRLGMEPYFANDLTSMLRVVQDLFLSHENPEVARSTANRRISMIVMELIDSSNYSLADESTAPTTNIFSRFVMTIPYFLEAWASDYLYESRKLLEGLHRLIRQARGNARSHIVDSIRHNWHKLVANRAENPSVFELYPWRLQKISLSLIVLLESPSDESLKYLAYICSRPPLKRETDAYHEDLSRGIVEAVQKIRKSISMQRYLTFLFQSIGISRYVKVALRLESTIANQELNSSTKSVFEEVFFKADSQLSRVAKSLVEPGSLRVLKMIAPQLSSWQQTKIDEGSSSTEFLLKMRASHIILAYFFLQRWSAQEKRGSDEEVISALTEGGISIDVLTHSIFSFVRCIACNKEAMDFRIQLTSPIVGIISCEASVLLEVMSKMKNSLGEPSPSKSEQNNLLLIINDWMKDPRFEDSLASLSAPSKDMIETILQISRQ